MIEVDNRLCSIASVDKSRAALVDATSLKTLASILARNEIPGANLEGLLDSREGMSLANVIQTFVLHDRVYADSILFDRHDDINQAEKLFPDIVRRLFIPPKDRNDIADTLEATTRLWPDFYNLTDKDESRLLNWEAATKSLFSMSLWFNQRSRDCLPISLMTRAFKSKLKYTTTTPRFQFQSYNLTVPSSGLIIIYC